MHGRPFQLFMLAWALAALLLVQRLFFTGAKDGPEPDGAVAAAGPALDAQRWFDRLEPRCVAEEALGAVASDPAPATFEGVAFEAACLALAGETDAARARIEGLEGGRRWRAAGIVFEQAHPIADGGDEIAVGPAMELVVEVWPNHHQALYHAGSARFQRGDHEKARDYLTRFLVEYRIDDAWARDARSMMERIVTGQGEGG